MYDYATQTLQNRTIQEIQTTNTKIDNLSDTINYNTTLLATILITMLIRKLIIKCLGGKE